MVFLRLQSELLLRPVQQFCPENGLVPAPASCKQANGTPRRTDSLPQRKCLWRNFRPSGASGWTSVRHQRNSSLTHTPRAPERRGGAQQDNAGGMRNARALWPAFRLRYLPEGE